MNEQQIRNGLRKHWMWLRKKTDSEEVAEIIISHGRRKEKSIPNLLIRDLSNLMMFFIYILISMLLIISWILLLPSIIIYTFYRTILSIKSYGGSSTVDFFRFVMGQEGGKKNE